MVFLRGRLRLPMGPNAGVYGKLRRYKCRPRGFERSPPGQSGIKRCQVLFRQSG
ncbi:hypothetical protein C4K23_1473 [Pseudomonas chlororaphis]|nr:hypothetical protein C4K23_1473 [Pseudomonas chlororaphis]